MCLICDGWTPEQVLQHHLDDTDRVGFSVVAVHGEVSWVYTVGLRWRFDLPELAVVGWPPDDAAHVIHHAVELARDGAPALRCGSTLTVGDGHIGVGRVAPANLVGEWFAWCSEIARAADRGHRSLRAVQLRPSCVGSCREPHDLLDRALERRRTPASLARARRRLLGDELGDESGR